MLTGLLREPLKSLASNNFLEEFSDSLACSNLNLHRSFNSGDMDLLSFSLYVFKKRDDIFIVLVIFRIS
jgi:hypothetical protein